MHRIVAVGDVHGQWAELWQALRAAGLAQGVGEPTSSLTGGRAQLVLVGDLVHYKDRHGYARAVGEETFDGSCPRQLRRAAKAQIRELYRFKSYMERSGGGVDVILGNHDEVAVSRRYTLMTRGGLEHSEFDPDKGGLALPEDLCAWMTAFPRQKILGGIHFAHAGPLVGMQDYDDFFYHDPDTKNWWQNKPELAQQSGGRFGVYGHTAMPGGIYLDRDNLFAMIDALEKREYLELAFDDDDLYAEIKTF